jgi:hypothetical protein
MIKKITMFVLLVIMAVGIFISVANFIGTDLNSAPCRQVAYHPEKPDCYGPGSSCWDCTGHTPFE